MLIIVRAESDLTSLPLLDGWRKSGHIIIIIIIFITFTRRFSEKQPLHPNMNGQNKKRGNIHMHVQDPCDSNIMGGH